VSYGLERGCIFFCSQCGIGALSSRRLMILVCTPEFGVQRKGTVNCRGIYDLIKVAPRLEISFVHESRLRAK